MALIPDGNVITIRTRSLGATLVNACRAIARMRRERIDTAIDLEFFARSSVALAFLSGARHRVGFHAFSGEASYRGNLLTHRLSFNDHLHTSQTFDMLVAALDRSPATLPALDIRPRVDNQALPRFEARADEAAEVRRLLREVIGDRASAPLILPECECQRSAAAAPLAARAYVELARGLIDRCEIVIAFTGAPDERRVRRTRSSGGIAAGRVAGRGNHHQTAPHRVRAGRSARHQRQRTGTLRRPDPY
jgi:ADP-heptose:LPS heptosyltransferase